MFNFNWFEKQILGGIREGAIKGPISISTSLGPKASYTEEIDLGGKYNGAMVQLQVPQSHSSLYRKYGITIMAGDAANEAIAGANYERSILVYCGCYTSCIAFKFYMKQNDNILSNAFFGSSLGRAQIHGCYIDDNILKIIIYNPHSIQTSSVKLDGRFIAWKMRSI